MKRNKFLAALLTLVMLLSLVPVTALATDEDAGGDPVDSDIQYGSWVEEYNEYFHEWGIKWSDVAPNYTDPNGKNYVELPEGVVSLDKVAEKTDAPYTYDITLSVVMEQTTETTAPGAAATVLAIDCSGSMAYCAIHGEGVCDCKDTYKVIAYDSLDTSKTYYIQVNGRYIPVNYCDGKHFFNVLLCSGGAGWYPADKVLLSQHTSGVKINKNTTAFYERNEGTRADAAKNAARVPCLLQRLHRF